MEFEKLIADRFSVRNFEERQLEKEVMFDAVSGAFYKLSAHG